MTDDREPMALRECNDCGWRTFYESRRCRSCGGRQWTDCEPGTGTLLAVTTVHFTPEGVPQPNDLGLAAFEGARLIAQRDPDLEVGDRVRLAIDEPLRETDDGTIRGVRLELAD